MTRMKALYPSTCGSGLVPRLQAAPYKKCAQGMDRRGIPPSDMSRVASMQENELQALMGRFELLIERVEQLKRQNALLQAQEKSWREERAHLIEKNEVARRKIESMIVRLKALEQDS